MQLEAFSIRLAVKDLTISRNFYQKLGFRPFAGDLSQNYVIMKNGDTLIELFQGMFQKNILTFHPGRTSMPKIWMNFRMYGSCRSH